MTKKLSRCRRQAIGGSGAFLVESCGCGAVHVTIGFVTLRLDPLAYRELMRAVNEGGRALASRVDSVLH
jgi:hypothetical protein